MSPVPVLSGRRRGMRLPHRQDGMALVIAMMVLLVVSILGAVSMRTALFQNRVSINSQTYNIAFQAAESGLDATLAAVTAQINAGYPVANTYNIFNQAVNFHGQRLCFNNSTGAITVGANGALTGPVTVDQQTTVNPDGSTTYTAPCPTVAGSNSSVTTVVGPAPTGASTALQSFDIKYGGSLILIETRAYSSVPNTNVQTVHAQQWGVVGPSNSEGG